MYLRLVEQEAGPLVKESLRDGLSQARDEVARLDRLLANLVDLHRHGHVMIRPGLVDAGRVVSDAVRRTSWELGVTQVDVEVGAADLLDWWDASAVDQIVHNLLSNAVQYADGRPCSVKVDRVAGALRVRVTDSGGGISGRGARAPVSPARSGRAARAPPAWAWGSGSFASWRKRTGAAPRSRVARVPARPSPSAWRRSARRFRAARPRPRAPLRSRAYLPPPRTRANAPRVSTERPAVRFRRVGCINISKRQPTRRKKPTRGEQRRMKGQRARRA